MEMGPATVSQRTDISDAVGSGCEPGRHSGGCLSKEQRDIVVTARLLGIVWMTRDDVEHFWALGSGRPEFECLNTDIPVCR